MSDPQQTLLAVNDRFIVQRRDHRGLFSLTRASAASKRLSEGSWDIVHLHWFLIDDLAALSEAPKRPKLVITAHDMYSFTGGCHSNTLCQELKNSCAGCPAVRKPFEAAVRRRLMQKVQLLERFRSVKFIAPSQTFKNLLDASPLASKFQTFLVANPVASIWNRQREHVPLDEEVLVFGFIAENIWDENKNLKDVINIVNIMKKSGERVRLEVVGRGAPTRHEDAVLYFGSQPAEKVRQIAEKWTALIIASIEENAPLIALEMSAMGVPVIVPDRTYGRDLQSTVGGCHTFNQDLSVWSQAKQILDLTKSFGQEIQSTSQRKIGRDQYLRDLLSIYELE